jgi:hypothetical protein
MRLAVSVLVLLAPATVPPSDGSALHLSSGDDYTVLGALAELPASTETDALLVQTGDLVAATELAALERPSEPDIDAVASWILPLTGLPREDEFAPLFVPLGQVFNYQNLADIAQFDDALGWSLIDADAFVEQSTPPESFAVITGDFDETTLNPDLTEVADGVVSYGEGDDFETNLSGDPNPVDRLGRPVRLARDRDRIAASFSTPFVQQWLAGADETLADDAELAAVATALDEADVVAAVLTRVESGFDQLGSSQPLSSEVVAQLQDRLQNQVPSAPFDAVGFGWNVLDGEAAITVAYHFSSAEEAADSVASLERLYREGESLVTRQPISELVTIEDIVAAGDVVSVSLSVPDDSRPQVIYDMLLRRDVPFISR